MQLFLKLFIEDKGDYIFGPGRMELLQAVHEFGSLRKAALKIGMSYRWAWGRIRDTEKALDVPLLINDPDSKRQTKILTEQAHELLLWYGSIEKQLQGILAQASASRPDFLYTNWAEPSLRQQKMKA